CDAIYRGYLSLTSGVVIVPALLVFFFVVTVVTALVGYHGIPVRDAVWVMFQTKIFATGNLTAPAPPLPEFFAARWVMHNGRWFSYTSPGHSLTLLPMTALGVPWLTGPLLGTLSIWLTYRIAVRLYGASPGRTLLILSATSPALIALFGSFDFHVSSVFFTVLGLYFATCSREPVGSLIAGLSLGLVFLARPYTGLAVGLPLLIFVVLSSRQMDSKLALGKTILAAMLAFSTPVVLHLLYNKAVTGNHLVFPYNLMGRVHAIGFGQDIGEPGYHGIIGHSLLRATLNTGYALLAASFQYLGWMFFSLIPFVCAVRLPRLRRQWQLWAPGLTLVLAYFFYWCHGVTPWGPKYWSELLPSFLLISSAVFSPTAAAPLAPKADWLGPTWRLRTAAFLIAYSLTVSLPTTLLYLASGNWGETTKIARRVRAERIHNAIVFVHGDEQSGSLDYTSAFLFNDPFLNGDVVFARDLGEQNARLAALYPGRSYYRYDFNADSLNREELNQL
ncbi:MAG: glycosyltransferase family 39 protein, partial [candidate division WOR-3 bacterium]